MTHFINSAAREALSKLSIAELEARLVFIQASGERAKAALNTASGNEVVSMCVRAGRFVDVTRAGSALNACRLAWKDTKAILDEKKAA